MLANSPPTERRGLPREKCVHFRFKLRGGYDFQAVAFDASTLSAAFEKHYEDSLSKAATGYFETPAGEFDITALKISHLPSDGKLLREGLKLSYTCGQPASHQLSKQQFCYIRLKMSALHQHNLH